MSASRGLVCVLGLSCLFSLLSAVAVAAVGSDTSTRIPVSGIAVTAIPVPSWDSASPQQLVRIDHVLYQRDGGFFYRVIEDRPLSPSASVGPPLPSRSSMIPSMGFESM